MRSKKKYAAAIRSRRHRRKKLRVLLVSGSIFLAFWIVVLILPSSPPFTIIRASTESVSFVSTRANLSDIPLIQATVTPVPRECEGLISDGRFDGLASPHVGTHVTYRQAGDRILVEFRSPTTPGQDNADLRPSGRLVLKDERSCETGPVVRFAFDVARDLSASSRPLPIAGPAEIGRELAVPLAPDANTRRPIGMLWGGQVSILGRSTNPVTGGALYPALEMEFPIPAGSRLTSMAGISAPDFTGATDDFLSRAWYGVATPGSMALDVSATTETDSLRLFRPGRSQDSERFRTTLFAQLFNDPGLVFVSISVFVLSLAVQTVLAWTAAFSRPRLRRRKR